MPRSLKLALADALVLDHPDAPWQPPEQLPLPVDLRRGVAILQQSLQAVDRKHAAYCLSKLAAGFREQLSADDAKLRTDLWLEVCGHVPADLWSAATIELIGSWKRDAHFGRLPEAADFLDVVDARLKRRQVELQRTQAMLRKVNESESKPSQEGGPTKRPAFGDVRLLKERLTEMQQRPGLSDSDRLFNCANIERSLALFEKRAMQHWAQSFFDDRVKTRGGLGRDSVGSAARTVAESSSGVGQATRDRLAELAKAQREGRPPPAHPREFSDIPEVEDMGADR